jgi:hypothetical protein
MRDTEGIGGAEIRYFVSLLISLYHFKTDIAMLRY